MANKYSSALCCVLIVLSILDPIKCARGFGGRSGGFGRGGGSHGYPSSHGLSGSGHRSGGLSGGGHGYPSSGGSHGYPSSGGSSSGSHGYPSSGGLSGNGGSNPSSNSHGYPSSGGKHTYPSSSGGLSGSQSHGYPANKPQSTHTTVVNHHYHYSPPQQIRYAAPGYSRPVSYPVYQGSPPTYVYQYKNSGSKYGTLLAGLALLNLGALAGTAYAHSRSHSNYKPQPGEVCKFGVKKDNGDYEETKIDCQLITSFIYQEQAKMPAAAGGTNSVITTTVTNTTIVNSTNTGIGGPQTPVPEVLYKMLSNGTLVPINQTDPGAANATNIAPNGTMTSSVVVTTTTTNTTNALDVKGKEVEVTPTMQCFVIRTTPTNNMRKNIPCGLLQTYATQSLKRNAAARNIPTFTILFAIAAFVIN